MTARAEIDMALEEFRRSQAAAERKRKAVLARRIGSPMPPGMVASSGGGAAQIVSEAATWTIDDELQAENYRFNGVMKLVGAVALVLIGTVLLFWLVNSVVS